MAAGDRNIQCRVYVGNLPPDVRNKDIEDLFQKFGKITYIDLKNKKGPPFAFLEYEDRRDAEDAIRGRDGYDYDGYRLRVEFPRGNGPYTPGRNANSFRDGGRGGMGKRGNYRVIISGLPPGGSWQDLKDHMREAGDVCYADVFRDGTGVVEYMRHDDMRYAIRKLNDTKFRSHEGETTYIRVRAESEAGGSRRSHSRSRSRSPPRRARDSPTYSPPPGRGYSRSRSRSSSRSRSRSSRSR